MSDLPVLAALHRAFVNERERRLRAGWRLLVAVAASAVALVVAAETLIAVTDGGVASSAAVGRSLVKGAVATAIVVVAWVVDARTLADIGLSGRGLWRNVGFGSALGVVMITSVFAVELATGLVTVRDVFVTRPGFGLETALPFAQGFAITLLVYIVVGVSEEVIVRGYLFTNVAEALNGTGPVGHRTAIGTAAVATSGLFGLLHLGNPNATAVSTLNVGLLGLFLAATYVATENLGIAIGVHVTWNASLASLYGFPVSGYPTPATVLDVSQTGDPLLTGGEFGPEAGLVAYLALAVGVALTWWWIGRVEGGVRLREGVAVLDRREPLTAFLG